MNSCAPTPEFWANRRVFLTGHTGFKGSWLAAWLTGLGAQVRGFALDPDRSAVPHGYRSLFEELGLAKQMTHQIGDIRDLGTLSAAMAEFDPEVVIHMAAQPLVRLSYEQPVETYATNVMGTVNLLQSCRALPSLRSVVIVTSDKCYENREQIWGYRETDAMGGHDPYSNSKGCAELVTASFRNSFFPIDRHADHGVAVASGRAGNVIGGGDWSADRLIPDAMRAFVSGQNLTLRNPGALRPWQHVLEPLSGYLRLAELGYTAPETIARGWNFGPGDAMTLSVGEVITQLAHDLGPQFQWRVDTPKNAPHEANLLKLDCSASHQYLNWHPQFDCAKMCALTAQWYRAADPDERRAIAQSQIKEISATGVAAI